MRRDVDLIIQPYVRNQKSHAWLEGDRYRVLPLINKMVRRGECVRPNYMILNEQTGRVTIPLVMLKSKRPWWMRRKRTI